MTTLSSEQLRSKKCTACAGGVEKYTAEQARAQMKSLPDWRLSRDGQRIRRDWQVKDFQAGIDFFHEVARLAEEEGHHPDLHLEDYRHVWIELWTHAIGGLSDNDFVLAAKINALPIVAARIPRPVSLAGAAKA